MDSDDDELPPQLQASTPLTVSSDMAIKPVPVTILTGFLGSGKTTLLNRLLRESHGRRIAVVENEFGPGLDIEGLIARDGTSDQAAKGSDESGMTRFVELSNGCICCSVKDSLVAAMEELVQRALSSGAPLDHIVVETSGLAQPGPVAGLFWLDDALEAKVTLDGIVTVVDAFHLPKNLSLGGPWRGFAPSPTAQPGMPNEDASALATADATCAAQIAYADRVVLNKVDLVGVREDHQAGELAASETLATLFGLVKGVNPLAEVVPTTHCDVPLEWVLDCHAYDHQKAAVKPPLPSSNIDSSGGISSNSNSSGNGSSNNSPGTDLKPWQVAMSEAAASASTAGGQGLEGEESLPWHGGHPVGVSSLSLELPGAVVSQPWLEQWLASLLWKPISSQAPAAAAAAAAAADDASKQPPPAAPGTAALGTAALGTMSQGAGGMGDEDSGKKSIDDLPKARTEARGVEHPFGFLAMNVFRMKGVLAVADSREDSDTPSGQASPFKHLLQVVHGTFDVTKTDELWEAADGQHADLDGSSQQKKTFGYGARVVVIGRYLDRRKLERGLKATVMTTAAGLQN